MLEGRGLPILVMPLGIVPQTPCQRIFVQSDPGVPRTFVVDCSLALKNSRLRQLQTKSYFILFMFSIQPTILRKCHV